jgi:hypothetical protein
MARMTPTLGAKGVYTLRTPWTISSTVLYECIALRSISDFVDRGVDVLSKVYTPVGLTSTALASDVDAGAMIVTLTAPGRSPIYVPDTYIQTFPAMDGVPYSHVLLSLSLGALPDALDLSFIKAQLAATVEASFGVTPEINAHTAASTGYVTQAQHESWETARQAAVTNSTTDRARMLELQSTVDAQAQKIAELEAVIKQLSPP